MAEEKLPELGNTSRDHGVAVLRGALGSIPGVGAALAEIVTHFIPNQRKDRIEEYLRRLEDKLPNLSQEDVRRKAQDPDNIDLFEEGGFQSARATTEERREQIAKVVAFGLGGEEKERIEAMRILRLLRELDGDQLIILAAHLNKNAFDDDFHDRHRAILNGPFVHMQSDRDEIDQGTMAELAKAQLVSLGLLRPRFKTIKKGEIPEFDSKTGLMKRQSMGLSPLGRLVLRRVGLAGEDDF